MSEQLAITPVIFRKFPESKGGDVIAIMPYYNDDDGAGVGTSCYMHVGQHGTCDVSIIEKTKPATEAEYADLKKELEGEPYNYRFKVIKRWPSYRSIENYRRGNNS